MGMDLYSTKPKNDAYFRANVWHWRPIVNYCEEIAPDLTDYTYWHYNDGVGLDKLKSLELASILQREMDSGGIAIYQQEYVDRLQAMPDERCAICHGTGERYDGAKCGVCEGKGMKRPIETYYHFDITAVAEFIQFLQICEGFQIF